jgi:spore germination protein KA
MEEQISFFKELLKDEQTLLYKKFESKASDSIVFCIIYSKPLIETDSLNNYVIRPIIERDISKNISEDQRLEYLLSKVLVYCDSKASTDINEAVNFLLLGGTILLVEGIDEIILLSTESRKKRDIKEPDSEKIVKGPRDGFIESLETNIALLRQKVRHPNLKFKFIELGVQTKTKLCICYIEDIASPKILEELYKRIKEFDLDGVLGAQYLQEYIQDAPFSPFQTINYTERPDVAAGKLLEGRIAIILDGTPIVLTLPCIFIEYLQSNEDYFQNYFYASLFRILRSVGFFLTTSVPAIYMAIVTYHQEMLPTPLLLSIAAAREGVPFPTILELLIMLFVFEIIIEAGRRLPSPMGQAVSIVGTLVLGESAVSARFVSAPIVIITATTGISSFLISKLYAPAIIARTVCLILSSMLGLYGYIFAAIGFTIHLMTIRSFGVPYTMNVSSLKPEHIKDTFIRAPWWYMKHRSKLIAGKNILRKGKTKGR